MSIIEHCKFSMRPPDELDDDQREEVRFTVQSDMKASEYTPLMMTWAHFVWICLALDVRPMIHRGSQASLTPSKTGREKT
jgi:hypothetical protein